MHDPGERYDRNVRLFGAEGQRALRQTSATLVGVGGLGSALAQHLELLGAGSVTVIDPEELEDSNRNRLVGARADDPVPGTSKVEIARRMIEQR